MNIRCRRPDGHTYQLQWQKEGQLSKTDATMWSGHKGSSCELHESCGYYVGVWRRNVHLGWQRPDADPHALPVKTMSVVHMNNS